MKLVFIHGWSVTSTETYGELPQVLASLADPSLAIEIKHIYLGRYISFNDAVTLDDIAIAFESARKRELGDSEFSVITHSTGGPVVRAWLSRFYPLALAQVPLKHLIMLAPANHGSALAQLGKSRISRLKAWFDGVEPGQRVLDWLELGSDGQHQLNHEWLDWNCLEKGVYPFVFTGETIDKALYDYMNSYTGEVGSDGVVRVAAANLNFSCLELMQQESQTCISFDGQCAQLLQLTEQKSSLSQYVFDVIPKASHSNKKMGILNAVTRRNAQNKPVVQRILASLLVESVSDYKVLRQRLVDNAQRQDNNRYCMMVVRICDDLGHGVTDFDFFLLCGDDYHAGNLPRGLILDKQRNSINGNTITLYLDANKLHKLKAGKLGFKVSARPDYGFSYYKSAEFHCQPEQVSQWLCADQTLMLDITLKRYIADDTFSFAQVGDEPSFKSLAGD
ncbi:esterase/lipase family protein [Shewanella colwelliana]|uniref:esterase/lipase family protein n=1 Tax=Shewanella colwelliana TaxID=23 RepID=UPI0022B046E4|nr:alpha/beta hydrolase [Shewanella colwelliana]MCZ4338269.1 alpha/beta hydrolase [Shewanella colwelliana]